MEPLEETRPSFHMNSFASTAFKNSLTENLPDDPKKIFRKHLKYQSPYKELLTSRGANFLTPRTQISSLSNTQEKVIGNLSENFSKIRDELKSTETNIYDLTQDDDFKDFPTLKWCPFCNKEIATEIIYKNSSKTF